MNQLTIDAFRTMLRKAFLHIQERENEFSLLDAQTGDGDHGTAMVAAFSSAVKTAESGTEFKSMLNDMGFAVMTESSGSTSTLLGSFFLGMSDEASGVELDMAGVKAMFAAGLANVKKQTKAQTGDKTMMDALIPAVNAMQECDCDTLGELFAAAAAEAKKGAEATVDMVARFGRARNYGERSKGFMDSGAASWSVMFGAFAEQ